VKPILEESAQRSQGPRSKGIDYCAATRRRELQQIYAIDKTVEARTLSVDGEPAYTPQPGHEFVGIGGRLYVRGQAGGAFGRGRRRVGW
jgi:hypothetical protein